VALVTWLALRGEARRCTRALVMLADPAVAVGAEIAALGSPARRFRIRWAAYVRGGWAAARPVRRLHRAQAALARFLATPDGKQYGVAALLGVVSLVLAAVFAGQLLVLVFG
jgi:hypothetical protein